VRERELNMMAMMMMRRLMWINMVFVKETTPEEETQLQYLIETT